MALRLAWLWLVLVALAGLAAPWLYPGDPLDMVAVPLAPAFTDGALPLGSDRLGRDLAALLVHGGRDSLRLGLLAAASAVAIGLGVGVLAGFLGGWIDRGLMAITEAIQTVPAVVLALALLAVLGPGRTSLGLAIILVSWPAMAQLVRSQTRLLRNRDYIAAARLAGQGPAALIRDQLLPNLLPLILVLLSNGISSALLIETALSYLGLGDPDAMSWGRLIAQGRDVLHSAPHIALAPGAAILFTLLAVTLVSDWLDRRYDPRRA